MGLLAPAAWASGVMINDMKTLIEMRLSTWLKVVVAVGCSLSAVQDGASGKGGLLGPITCMRWLATVAGAALPLFGGTVGTPRGVGTVWVRVHVWLGGFVHMRGSIV